MWVRAPPEVVGNPNRSFPIFWNTERDVLSFKGPDGNVDVVWTAYRGEVEGKERLYYHNTETGEVTWKVPRLAQGGAPSDNSDVEISPNLIEPPMQAMHEGGNVPGKWILGIEPKATFKDSRGLLHDVRVSLPESLIDQRAKIPCVVYMHGMGWDAPFLGSSSDKWGCLANAANKFIIFSPIFKGVSEKDCYITSFYSKDHYVRVIGELLREIGRGFGRGKSLRIDPDRLAVTGVSFGGALAYMVAASFPEYVSCVAPVAAYHSKMNFEFIATRLADINMFCVHSETDTCCEIALEEELWQACERNGKRVVVSRVRCQHGKTFNHAYVYNDLLWAWIAGQVRAQPSRKEEEVGWQASGAARRA